MYSIEYSHFISEPDITETKKSVSFSPYYLITIKYINIRLVIICYVIVCVIIITYTKEIHAYSYKGVDVIFNY